MPTVTEHVTLLDAYNTSRHWRYTLSFVAIIALLTMVSYWYPAIAMNKLHNRPLSTTASRTAPTDQSISTIKIIAINSINWNILQSAMKSYRTETNAALEQLSMTLEVVESEERKHGYKSSDNDWKLSNHIREKILRLSQLYDQDMEVLENMILVPFPTIQALPNSQISTTVSAIEVSTSTSTDANTDTSIAKVETNFTWWSERNAQIFRNKVEPYDSIRQVIAHIVRDWSSTEGAIIRDTIYRWCIEQLQVYQYTSSNGPILVPGAGLGRLVWDISQNIRGTVEGLESSVCMTAAAHTIFHTTRKNAFVLHPFAADSFSNEIDHEARYDIISFPDVKPSIRVGTVSYTVGIFGLENMQHCANRYGAIVTSFFIDTATTVYDFISTIAMVLSIGGLWINVGPLQWHINNKVPVSVNELYMMLKQFRDQTTGHHVFQILYWSVDEHPIRYRNHGGRNRSTYYDGYCPLRFVIRKK